MERRVNYLLVGVFSLLTIAGIIAFILWMHHRSQNKGLQPYIIFFDRAVSGLNLGGSVKYLGVDVGRVQAIELNISQPVPRVQITVGIDKTIPITEGTLASVKPSGITGVSYIDLRADGNNTTPLPRVPGEIPVINSELSTFDLLLGEAASTAKRVDAILSRAEKIMSDENVQRFSDTLGNLQSASQIFSAHQEDMELFIRDAAAAAHSLNIMMADFRKSGTEKNIKTISAELQKTSASLEDTSKRINNLLIKHDAAINQFMGPDLDDLQKTIREARKTMQDISTLAKSLNENPSQIIIPKTPGGVKINP